MSIRISTGIPGLDQLVGGGFEVSSIILLSGGPGTGKTTFCLQFLYHGATKGENGLYISFEETEDDLIRDARNFGWDLEDLIKKKKLVIKHYSPFEYDKFKEELTSLLKLHNVKRLVIDSISGLGFYLENKYEFRKRIWELSREVKNAGCTAIFTSEIPAEKGYSRFGVEEFIADGLIVLHFGGLGGEFDRTLQVVKMRRTNHKKGLFPFKITQKGVRVYPRSG
ncbi:MAG: AAA family ATPase [Nanoarchaeota archaeon]|nr:AAA family ATPase [Nanoarchaeota archaeon]